MPRSTIQASEQDGSASDSSSRMTRSQAWRISASSKSQSDSETLLKVEKKLQRGRRFSARKLAGKPSLPKDAQEAHTNIQMDKSQEEQAKLQLHISRVERDLKSLEVKKLEKEAEMLKAQMQKKVLDIKAAKAEVAVGNMVVKEHRDLYSGIKFDVNHLANAPSSDFPDFTTDLATSSECDEEEDNDELGMNIDNLVQSRRRTL